MPTFCDKCVFQYVCVCVSAISIRVGHVVCWLQVVNIHTFIGIYIMCVLYSTKSQLHIDYFPILSAISSFEIFQSVQFNREGLALFYHKFNFFFSHLLPGANGNRYFHKIHPAAADPNLISIWKVENRERKKVHKIHSNFNKRKKFNSKKWNSYTTTVEKIVGLLCCTLLFCRVHLNEILWLLSLTFQRSATICTYIAKVLGWLALCVQKWQQCCKIK